MDMTVQDASDRTSWRKAICCGEPEKKEEWILTTKCMPNYN